MGEFHHALITFIRALLHRKSIRLTLKKDPDVSGKCVIFLRTYAGADCWCSVSCPGTPDILTPPNKGIWNVCYLNGMWKTRKIIEMTDDGMKTEANQVSLPRRTSHGAPRPGQVLGRIHESWW